LSARYYLVARIINYIVTHAKQAVNEKLAFAREERKNRILPKTAKKAAQIFLTDSCRRRLI
jgi:hypothetical protein